MVYVQGPVSVTCLEKNGKYVYVFGDIHTRGTEQCADGENGMLVENFFEDFFSTGKDISFFLESSNIEKDIPLISKHYIGDLLTRFGDCLYPSPQWPNSTDCEFDNVKFFPSDARPNGASQLSYLVHGIGQLRDFINNYAGVATYEPENIEKIDYCQHRLLTLMLNIQTNYNEYFIEHNQGLTHMKKLIYTELVAYKFFKKQSSDTILKKSMKDMMNNAITQNYDTYIDCMRKFIKTINKILKHPSTLTIEKLRPVMDTSSDCIPLILNMTTYILDFYIYERLNESEHNVIYVGANHARNITTLLSEIGYEQIYQDGEDWEYKLKNGIQMNSCINVECNMLN